MTPTFTGDVVSYSVTGNTQIDLCANDYSLTSPMWGPDPINAYAAQSITSGQDVLVLSNKFLVIEL